jgi:hypothetical protein
VFAHYTAAAVAKYKVELKRRASQGRHKNLLHLHRRRPLVVKPPEAAMALMARPDLIERKCN